MWSRQTQVLITEFHPWEVRLVNYEQADPARFPAVHDAYAFVRATRRRTTWITIRPPVVFPARSGRGRP